MAETVWPWGNGGHVRVTHKPTRRRKPAPEPVPSQAMAADLDAPCCTTASGRNPWPAIHLERALAGEPVQPEWAEAVAAEAERQGIDWKREIW